MDIKVFQNKLKESLSFLCGHRQRKQLGLSFYGFTIWSLFIGFVIKDPDPPDEEDTKVLEEKT